MVDNAASHGATWPSYLGPESQKFISNGLAALAAWPACKQAEQDAEHGAKAGFFQGCEQVAHG